MDSDDEAEEQVLVETSEDWKNRGNDFYKAKNYSSAVEAYGRAISLDLAAPLLYTNRAAAYLMLQQYKEALSDCDTALQLDITCAKAYFRKASALRGLGRLEEALAAVTSGLEHDPNNAVGKSDKTSLTNIKSKLVEMEHYFQSNQFSSALVLMDQLSRELGAGNRQLNIRRVECLVKLKRLEEAYNLSNTMMRSAANGDVELLKLRASCLLAMGDVENAFKHLQQAVKSDPDNTQVRAQYRMVREIQEKKNIGDEAFKLNKLPEAIAAWTDCIDLAKDSPSFLAKLHLNRGTALAKQKKHEDACKDCTKAIYYDPEYTKAYTRRSDSYLAQGGPEKIQRAIDDLDRAMELEKDETAARSLQQKKQKAEVLLRRSKRKDLYAMLGVTSEATEAEIKSAYKKSALKWHPDRHSSKSEEEKAEAENKFKSIGEAYEVLSNPEKKARYDEGVEVEDIDNPQAGPGGHHQHGGHGGIDPNILFQMFMQQQMGGGGGGGRGRGGFGGGF